MQVCSLILSWLKNGSNSLLKERKKHSVRTVNNLIRQIRPYLKPMLLGFLFFMGILFLLTMIYASSRLEPLTGDWQVTINNQEVSSSFPISHVIRDGEEITIKKTINLPPNRDFLTFSVYPTINGKI